MPSPPKGRRPSANPGRRLTGRGLRNLIRLRGGRIVRQQGRHLLMEWEGMLVTVPMLKGPLPHSTLRSVAATLNTPGRGTRWTYLYT